MDIFPKKKRKNTQHNGKIYITAQEDRGKVEGQQSLRHRDLLGSSV